MAAPGGSYYGILGHKSKAAHAAELAAASARLASTRSALERQTRLAELREQTREAEKRAFCA